MFVDGNNWYHGLKALGVDADELDYPLVAGKLVEDRVLGEIRYYVGQVTGNRQRVAVQKRVLARLQAQGVRVFPGRIQRNWLRPEQNPMVAKLTSVLRDLGPSIPEEVREQLDGLCRMSVPEYVEKQVDVQIAADLVSMAFQDEYDIAYLLSADADFVPAVRRVRGRGKRVFAVRSWRQRSAELKREVDAMIALPPEWFEGLRSNGG